MIKFLDAILDVFAFLANLCTVGVTASKLLGWVRKKIMKK